MTSVATVGLLAYVMDTQGTTSYSLAISVISVVYLILIILIPVEANVYAVCVLVFEFVVASLWLGACIVQGIISGGYNCTYAQYTYWSQYYYFHFTWVTPCRAEQATIGLAAFSFVLSMLACAIFWLNVIVPVNRVFEGSCEYVAHLRLTRGSNLAIRSRAIDLVDLEMGAKLEDSTAPVTAEQTTAEQTTAEPVIAEPVIGNPVIAEPVTAEPVTAEPVTTEPISYPKTSIPAETAEKGSRSELI